MAGDFNKPVLGDAYSDVLQEVRDINADMAKGLDPAVVSTTNIPTNTIRWNSALGYWQKFNGSTWDVLAATYAINAATSSKWATGRTITLTGDVTGASGSFDGSGNLSFAASLKINDATAKATPVDADVLAFGDSTTSYAMRKTTFAQLKTVLSTLYAALAGNSAQDFAAQKLTLSKALNEARGSVAMHATTMDLWAQPNVIDGTGSAVTITAIANAPQAGARRTLYPITGTIITNGATFAVDGAANYTTAAGDALEFEAITTSTYKVHITRKDGSAVVPTGTLIAFTKITATNAAWAPNANTKKMVVMCAGGGGGGGGCGSTAKSSPGGGAGAIGFAVSTSVSGTYAATIGAGGTGSSAASGTQGGSSSFIGTGLSTTSAGGLGGAILNISSSTGTGINGESGIGVGGAGGADADGSAATPNSAAGGGGGGSVSGYKAGGSGGSGVIYVWEYA